MLQIALLYSIVMAIVTIQTQKLREAIIYMGVFSITISFIYTLYHAPDVAMAEAIIGTAIATIIYIITLQKYQLFIIYVPISTIDEEDDLMKYGDQSSLIKRIEYFCVKESLEAQLIFTTEKVADIADKHDYSIIIYPSERNNYIIYSHPENYKDQELEEFLSDKAEDKFQYLFKEI